MQVWAGCQSRRADIANHLTLCYGRSGFEPTGIAIKMRVKRLVIIFMINSDAFAVIAFHTKGGNNAITGRENGCPATGGKIHPAMQARKAEYRVFTQAVTGG